MTFKEFMCRLGYHGPWKVINRSTYKYTKTSDWGDSCTETGPSVQFQCQTCFFEKLKDL